MTATRGTLQQLLAQFKNRDIRALSRLISFCENLDEQGSQALAELYPDLGHARVIGITGPPGAGKSSLTNHFIKLIRAAQKTVAVIAVDPVSPFTGGALLGDRIRLVDHFNDPGVFIRSLSTRGKLGGLSLATRQVVNLSDAFHFDYVIVETVGVGQSEVDVRKMVDVTLVVLVPEWGDAIQTLKAGVLEIGDIFVVNKSDREGADRLMAELKTMLQMANREATPLLQSTIKDPKTVEALFQSVTEFATQHADLVQKRRMNFSADTALELLETWILAESRSWLLGNHDPAATANPYRFISQFRQQHPNGSLFEK